VKCSVRSPLPTGVLRSFVAPQQVRRVHTRHPRPHPEHSVRYSESLTVVGLGAGFDPPYDRSHSSHVALASALCRQERARRGGRVVTVGSERIAADPCAFELGACRRVIRCRRCGSWAHRVDADLATGIRLYGLAVQRHAQLDHRPRGRLVADDVNADQLPQVELGTWVGDHRLGRLGRQTPAPVRPAEPPADRVDSATASSTSVLSSSRPLLVPPALALWCGEHQGEKDLARPGTRVRAPKGLDPLAS
jgi:hypothetical protein